MQAQINKNKSAMVLKCGREKAVNRHNYWIFSGAVEKYPEDVEPGGVVEVLDSKGNFLAQAGFSPKSQICGRIWSFCRTEKIDEEFFYRRLSAAKMLRDKLNLSSGGYRLCAAEGDALSGLVVDIYGKYIVLQILSMAAEYQKKNILQAIRRLFPERTAIIERSDAAVRLKEGLLESKGVLEGEVPAAVEFNEYQMLLTADLLNGHKTGFYFDQRENRRIVGSMCAGKRVLNLFSYTGAFAVSALCNGAEMVENVDSSKPALELSQKNIELNDLDSAKVTHTCANVFELLRNYAKQGKKFDIIVLDPPKLVDSQRNILKGCRAYKDLALSCFKLLDQNGLLFTFSCSALVDEQLFAKISCDAAIDAGKDAAILRRLHADADHPIRLNHPESNYLKGLMLLVN